MTKYIHYWGAPDASGTRRLMMGSEEDGRLCDGEVVNNPFGIPVGRWVWVDDVEVKLNGK